MKSYHNKRPLSIGSALERLEKRLESPFNGIERVVRRILRSPLRVDEVRAFLEEEMDDAIARNIASSQVPIYFQVYLHHDDYAHITRTDSPEESLAEKLQEHAGRRRYKLSGRPDVVLLMRDEDHQAAKLLPIITISPGKPKAQRLEPTGQLGTRPGKRVPLSGAGPHAPRRRATLQHTRGGRLKGHLYPIDGAIVSIGRGRNNSIMLEDKFTSKEHAKIAYRNGSYYLEDLRSENGTFVNDRRVQFNTAHELTSGDKIRIGSTQLEYVEI